MNIEIDSREYDCWHEAGHAVVCLLLGGRVELMELVEDEALLGRARASCEMTPETRKHIACGGFAAEYHLYVSGRLNVSEREFVRTALVNAFPDKRAFFGADYEVNGCWPAKLDVAFRDFAIYQVAPFIESARAMVEELATDLVQKGRLDATEIREVFRRHHPELQSVSDDNCSVEHD